MRAVLTEYRHGATCGIPPGRLNPNPAKRDVVRGWSQDSARRNTRFLYSVDERELSGVGFALTLTLRDCPWEAAEWRNLLKLLFMRLDRLGAIRVHWLVEWQRRGVPHLHAAVWFAQGDRSELAQAVRRSWLALAGCYGARPRGQHVVPIRDVLGWFGYVAKHGARGVRHYQRAAENIPEGWRKTGRMWGTRGEWVTVEPVRYLVAPAGFYAYRRILQRLELSRVRPTGDRWRIRSVRRMLQASSPELGRVRGTSVWVDWETNARVIAWLAAQGYSVRC